MNAPLTNFTGVNSNTSLQSLNLNWTEKDLPQKERTKHVHGMHPYMGKFVPQLVEMCLRKFEPKAVYDPFCGSGTTLVESKALGINSWGADISVFNALLAKVKTDNYNVDCLETESKKILSRLVDGMFTMDADGYLGDWFSPQALGELNHYREAIRDMNNEDLFRVVLSRSARSARLVPHYDLDFPNKPQTEAYHCHKHKRTCYPVKEANKFLKRYTKDAVKRIKEFHNRYPSAGASAATVIHGDSRTVDLPMGFDLVITSPPYVGLIDYHEQHRYAYELLELEDNSTQEIGPAFGGASKQAIINYKENINKVLEHTRDYMCDKSKMVVIVNDKHGVFIPEEVGFKEIIRLQREVNRRTGRRASGYHESVLVWEKV